VDSEHSAIFQCLEAANGNPVKRLILTASGGALRDFTKDQTARATVKDVLNHPVWLMGGKITVDCATMLNKGLEVIEAHYLFGVPVSDIDVVIHRQSVIHSMVEFRDGAVLAQLGNPDMRGPIGYAMGYPDRVPYGATPLNFAKIASLTFEEPDLERYPLLARAIEAIGVGGSAPVILNGANEVAVSRFLKGAIPFGDIAKIVSRALDSVPVRKVASLEDVFRADAEARRAAANQTGGILT
jgi:1-deoxy-D-xylulose-5-phosphate reductoisomerase